MIGTSILTINNAIPKLKANKEAIYCHISNHIKKYSTILSANAPIKKYMSLYFLVSRKKKCEEIKNKKTNNNDWNISFRKNNEKITII